MYAMWFSVDNKSVASMRHPWKLVIQSPNPSTSLKAGLLIPKLYDSLSKMWVIIVAPLPPMFWVIPKRALAIWFGPA